MGATWRQRLALRLQRSWWQPRKDPLAAALLPLSWIYRLLWAWHRGARARAGRPGEVPAVPVVVVGNLIVGGAGKTPAVIAIVTALARHGWHPGVISRGYGRASQGLCEVGDGSTPEDCGDEPILIRRGARAPVVVGRNRPHAAKWLCARHPEVDVIVSDDGLQHLALHRDVEVIVFDARGIGNGALLPAGPLREPFGLPRPAGEPLVLYTSGQSSTPLAGHLAHRDLAGAMPLSDWLAGRRESMRPLEALRDRPWLAVAGVAHPAAFFDALEARGLRIDRMPLPDHHRFDALPWPKGTAAVLLTEKDAVKLRGRDTGETQVWVVGLDFQLPDAFVQALRAKLGSPRKR